MSNEEEIQEHIKAWDAAEEELEDLWCKLHNLEEQIQDIKGFIYEKESEVKAHIKKIGELREK